MQQSRKSLRLRSYDYSGTGMYFVIVCTHDRKCLFGDVIEGQMRLNDAGRMIDQGWNRLPERFHNVELDQFVVMPNHIHGIIAILSTDVGAPLVGARHSDRDDSGSAGIVSSPAPGLRAGTRPAPTLGRIVGAFKSVTTLEYIRGVRVDQWPAFGQKLWQRDYYERIIRNEKELLEIRKYILENPKRWQEDPENSDVITRHGGSS
jgi:REP element-mobilizing transposase RayT